MRVRVADHTQINVGGTIYPGGALIEVAEEMIAEALKWLAAGWAVWVKPSPRKQASKDS